MIAVAVVIEEGVDIEGTVGLFEVDEVEDVEVEHRFRSMRRHTFSQ